MNVIKRNLKTITYILILLVIFYFAIPNYSICADDEDYDIGGVLFKPIAKLICGLSDLVVEGLQYHLVGDGDIKEDNGYYVEYGPALIFSGEVLGLDANFMAPDTNKITKKKYEDISDLRESFSIGDGVEVAKEDGSGLIGYGIAYNKIKKQAKDNHGYVEENEIELDELKGLIATADADDLLGYTVAQYQNFIRYGWYSADKKNVYVVLETNTTLTGGSTSYTFYIYKFNTIEELESVTESAEEGKTTVVSGDMITSPALQLQETISSWYKTLRQVAIVGLLSVLVYVGIRILMSSVSQDKAKYKKMFMNWAIAMCLLYVLHYIMVFTMLAVEEVQNIFTTETDAIVATSGDGEGEYDVLMSSVRQDLGDYSNPEFSTIFTQILIYLVLVIYTVMFTWTYLKRLLYLAFFTMIAPLIAFTYPLDKIKDGQAQAFSKWIKEYIYNALIPVVHLLLYYMFVGTAIEFAKANPLYALAAIAFLTPAEKFFKSMFGFDKATAMGQLGAAASGALIMNAVNKMKTAGGKSGGGGTSKGKDDNGVGYIPGPRQVNSTQTGGGNGSGSGGSDDSYNEPGNGAGNGNNHENDNNNSDTNNNGGDSRGSNNNSSDSSGGNNNSYNGNGSRNSNSSGNSAQNDPGQYILGQWVKQGKKPTETNGRWTAVKETGRQKINGRRIARSARKKARKTIVGAVGGIALGTIGLAAGLATGDASNVFQYAATAGAVGAASANELTQKGLDVEKENREAYNENLWGTDEYNTKKNIKELNENYEFRKLTKGKTKKQREKIVRDYHANGITSQKDIISAMSLQESMKEQGVTQNEIMAANKIKKRFGDTYKDVKQGLMDLQVPAEDIERAMDIIENIDW